MTPNAEAQDKPKLVTCTVCSAPLTEGASQCESCGATQGPEHKCPFCGVVAAPQKHPTLLLACPACGAPRVPAVPLLAPSKRVAEHLRKVRSARSSWLAWRLAAGLTLAFGALAAALLVGVSLVASPALFPLLAASVVAAMPFVFAGIAWHNAGRRATEVERELRAAWVQLAQHYTASRGAVRAHQLAEAFDIDDAQAQDLLAHVGALGEVITDVTDDGELALSMRAPGRLRIDVPPDARVRVEAPSEEEHEQVVDEEAADTARKLEP